MDGRVLLLVFVMAFALTLLWFMARRRTAARRIAKRAPDWTSTEDSPAGWEAHERPPDTVSHELDLVEWKYRVLATWHNDDVSAESDSSVVREQYDVEIDDQGAWRIRLAMRNGVVTDDRPWQPSAPELVPQWQSALDRRAREIATASSGGKAVPEGPVTLRDSQDADGVRRLTAALQGGDLVIEGRDYGAGVERVFGYREYEWVWTVKADDVPKLREALGDPLDLTASLVRFSGEAAARLGPFLDAQGVPYETWSRTGD